MKIIGILVVLMMLGGCMLSPATVEPSGEANRFGVTPKKKQSEVAFIAEQTSAALAALGPDAYSQPSCNPELTESAEMACVIGNAIALSVAYALNRPTTAAGEIAYAGADSVKSSADGLTRRSAARWGFARVLGAGYFAAKTAEVIGDANAAIASTVAANGGVRIGGNVIASSSRHPAGGSGEGEGGAVGSTSNGDSLTTLVIGNNNDTAVGSDAARVASGSAIQAEPSANVNLNNGTQKASPNADELNGDVNADDPDGLNL